MKKYIFCLFMLYASTASSEVYLEKPADFVPVVEVSACFIEQNGRFLFLHKQDHKSQGNTWGIPGGKVEKSETPLHAVVREVKEETGIAMNEESVRFIKTVYITNKARTNLSYVYHMYETAYDGPIVVTIDAAEHKGYTWVTLQDALKMELMDDEAPCIEIAYPRK